MSVKLNKVASDRRKHYCNHRVPLTRVQQNLPMPFDVLPRKNQRRINRLSLIPSLLTS
jgi:hypothetical protein